MPPYPHIERYYEDLQRLIERGGSENELRIRPSFQNCLAAYYVYHREKLIPMRELENALSNDQDGTVKDALAWPAAIRSNNPGGYKAFTECL